MVEWVDSYGCASSWTPLGSEKPAILTCVSVGWLIDDYVGCIVVVPHRAELQGGEATQGCGDITIPRVAITRIVDLQETSDG